MTTQPDTRPDPEACDAAARNIAAAYAGGFSPEEILHAHDRASARLIAGAHGETERAWAVAYARAGTTLLRGLRDDQSPHAPGQARTRGNLTPASAMPDRTPHPDPFYAARGWQADHGIYQRTGSRQAEPEAC